MGFLTNIIAGAHRVVGGAVVGFAPAAEWDTAPVADSLQGQTAAAPAGSADSAGALPRARMSAATDAGQAPHRVAIAGRTASQSDIAWTPPEDLPAPMPGSRGEHRAGGTTAAEASRGDTAPAAAENGAGSGRRGHVHHLEADGLVGPPAAAESGAVGSSALSHAQTTRERPYSDLSIDAGPDPSLAQTIPEDHRAPSGDPLSPAADCAQSGFDASAAVAPRALPVGATPTPPLAGGPERAAAAAASRLPSLQGGDGARADPASAVAAMPGDRAMVRRAAVAGEIRGSPLIPMAAVEAQPASAPASTPTQMHDSRMESAPSRAGKPRPAPLRASAGQAETREDFSANETPRRQSNLADRPSGTPARREEIKPPEIHIGLIEITVEAPKVEVRPAGSAAPSDFSSRLYLRGL